MKPLLSLRAIAPLVSLSLVPSFAHAFSVQDGIAAKDVTASGNTAWVCSARGQVDLLTAHPTLNNALNNAPLCRHIEASQNEVWSVTSRGGIFKTSPTNNGNYEWIKPSDATGADVGCNKQGVCYITGGEVHPEGFYVFKWSGNAFHLVEGVYGARLDVAPNGDLYVLERSGALSKFEESQLKVQDTPFEFGPQTTSYPQLAVAAASERTLIEGAADVTVSDTGEVYLRGADFALLKQNGSRWQTLPHQAFAVSAGQSLWFVTPEGKLYH